MNPVQLVFRWYRSLIFNPRYRGWVILATVLYLVIPFDISPDLLPLLGQIDDAALITLLAASLFQWFTEGANQPQTADRVTNDRVTESDRADEQTGPTIDVKAVSVESEDGHRED
ncbi:MAG: DUF1232 domain-containing protein [Cyanobacteria bacterium P01_H01_bin.119]